MKLTMNFMKMIFTTDTIFGLIHYIAVGICRGDPRVLGKAGVNEY